MTKTKHTSLETFLSLALTRPPARVLEALQSAVEGAVLAEIVPISDGAHAIVTCGMLRGWRERAGGSWLVSHDVAMFAKVLKHIERGNDALIESSPRFRTLATLVRFADDGGDRGRGEVLAAALRRFFDAYAFDAPDVETFCSCLMPLVEEDREREAEDLLPKIALEHDEANVLALLAMRPAA